MTFDIEVEFMRVTRYRAVLAAAAAAALVLVGCADSDRESDDEGGSNSDATLIFGTEGEIKSLDPTWASDGVTMRVGRQIFETLVTLEPGTTEVVGGLAETWESDDTGTVWTFNLRSGVKFHDGTDFNADAVCFNFDRWHNLPPGLAQDPDMTYYWQQLSGGFAENEEGRDDLSEPNYFSCEATDELTAVITLRVASSKFPGLLVLPIFGMHSPTALEEYDADNVSGAADAPVWPPYAEEHPTGTGPFKLDNWDRANEEVNLVRNDDYWGDPATIGRLVFKAIPDENGRRQALLSGDIHGYDLPPPADWETLRSEGMTLETRESATLLYLAFTQESNEALEDIQVRQAIAHALNRQAMVDAVMGEGGEVATQFTPPSFAGWNPDVTTYDYDPDAARSLLADAGYEEGELELTFYWPTDVTRPYMPDPQSIFELFQADLEAVGIVVDPVSEPWTPEYLGDVLNGEADLHFLGWTADYADTYNFIGTWFDGYQPQWGFREPEFFDRMATADAEPDADTRYGMYEELNAEIMEMLPGVPVSHSTPAIVFAPNVTGVVASPLQDEVFKTAQVSE